MNKFSKKSRVLIFITLFSCTSSFAFQLEETTITSIHESIMNHELTCEALISSYIHRIKLFNFSVTTSAPINALTEINRSALTYARALDAQFAQTGKLSGSLHCIPVILKDNMDAYDMTTTSGSFALLGNQPTSDAFLTSQLRNAGAIILAKGGMDEFAWGMTGVSSRSGRIGNAYDANKNPGGSSGGPAAAVSANFGVIGMGSDNSGSVRIPAVFNGLVGLRPSTGLISQSGLFPMGKVDGIAGPMTRNVTDLAKILDVVAQPDLQDNKTLHFSRPKTYTAYLNENGLQNKRIGIVTKVGKIDTFKNMPKEVMTIMQKAYADMQKLGANFIEIDLNQFDTNRDLNQAGEIQDINDYLSSYPATRKNFKDICESDRTRNFGSLEKCLQFMKKIKPKSAVIRAYAIFTKNKKYVESMMDKNHLDALFIPISTQGTASYDELSVNTWRAPVSSNTGMPSIAFVIGYLQNLPVGIELVAKQYAEPTLIEIAYAYEKHHPLRQAPVMPSANNQMTEKSIAEINNYISELGQQAYEDVLIKNNKLTVEKFQKIAKTVLP